MLCGSVNQVTERGSWESSLTVGRSSTACNAAPSPSGRTSSPRLTLCPREPRGTGPRLPRRSSGRVGPEVLLPRERTGVNPADADLVEVRLGVALELVDDHVQGASLLVRVRREPRGAGELHGPVRPIALPVDVAAVLEDLAPDRRVRLDDVDLLARRGAVEVEGPPVRVERVVHGGEVRHPGAGHRDRHERLHADDLQDLCRARDLAVRPLEVVLRHRRPRAGKARASYNGFRDAGGGGGGGGRRGPARAPPRAAAGAGRGGAGGAF